LKQGCCGSLSLHMLDEIKIEICAGGIEDVLTASAFSEVDRIELNSALECGGLTPSLSAFTQARKATDKKLLCMVRPRSAGFVYTEAEKEVMIEDACYFLEHGADGIVFGFLKKDDTIDVRAVRNMCELIHSYGKEAVFHKAFDLTANLSESCQTLISLKIDRILTSGGKDTVLKGASALHTLIHTYGQQKTGATQFHMSAKEMKQDHGTYPAVCADRIRRTLTALHYGLSDNRRILSDEDMGMLKDPFDPIR
jgi:copper homeostasis protein